MNIVQRNAFREFLKSEGYTDPEAWLQDYWDELPQLGICAQCGHTDWTCDPDTNLAQCPSCKQPDTFSSILILLGLI